MKKRLILTLTAMLLVCSALVLADSLSTDRLNYFSANDSTLNRTLHYRYTGSGTANVSIRLSAPFNWTTENACGYVQPDGAACTCDSASATAECQNVTVNGTFFNITPTFFTQAEYALSAASGNSTSGAGATATAQNATFIRVKDDEVLHTLVEFGRGRGNYFFDSLGRTGSASQGTGYPYVPNATKFELSFLHKVFNLKQYFGLATETAENATFTCTYTNNTVVRLHLSTDIQRGGEFISDYRIPEIEGSFERQGFLSQQFDQDESISVGNNFTINCTGLTYTLQAAGGNISVDEDAFTLTYRDPHPFNLSATTTTSTLANGTQIMDVTYSLTNLEVYPADDVRLELAAPRFCTFINVKGELFGESQDEYFFERTRMSAGSTEQVTLTARCDLSGDDSSGITELNLTGEDSVAEYVPTWEINAYNPVQYHQTLAASTSTVPVDLTENATVVNLIDTISIINQTLEDNNNFLSIINNTVDVINDTVESISTTVTENNVILNGLNLSFAVLNNTINVINGTVTSINNTVTEVLNLTLVMNTTIASINDTVTDINGTVTSINQTLADVVNLTLSINGTVTSINGTVSEIENLTLTINNSVHVINETVTSIEDTVVLVNGTVQLINDTVNDIEGGITIINNTLEVVNGTVNNIESTVNNIDSTVNNIENFVEDINASTTRDRLDPSATWFQPEDIILVDTLFIDNQDNPITGASCNISIMDSTLTTLVDNATMEETDIAGIPHYTYNVSNVTALGGEQSGKFVGHVRCKDGSKRAVFAEIDFEVHEISTGTGDLTGVLNKLERMEEFDQELVFLVTDSFGLREEAREDATQGRIPDALEKLSLANQQLVQVADRLSDTQTLSPKATPGGAVNVDASSTGWSLGLESYLWAIILVLSAILIYLFKHHHVHEPEF